jgi:hypothetical protein
VLADKGGAEARRCDCCPVIELILLHEQMKRKDAALLSAE